MSWTKKNVHPGKIVSTSQEVEVMVLEVDPVKRRISLGLKQTLANPWEVFVDKYPQGTVVEGEVKNKTEFGLFVGLDGDVDGMVHLSDLDWNRPGEQVIEEFRRGDKIKTVVLDVDVEKERISLGVKQLAGDPFEKAGDLRRGAIVTCEVTEVKDSGLEVKIIDTEFSTFIKRSELARERGDQRPDRFAVGERLDARVIQFDRKTRKVGVSIKALEVAEEKEAIAQFGSSDSRVPRSATSSVRRCAPAPKTSDRTGLAPVPSGRAGRPARGLRVSGCGFGRGLCRGRGLATPLRPDREGDTSHAARSRRHRRPATPRRRLGFWRIVAILLAVVAVGALAVRLGGLDGVGQKTKPHVARVTVKGLMLPDRPLVEMIDEIAKAEAVKGVIVEIDSPGGATTAGEALYGALRRLAEKKPTTAFVGTLAASAGYMTAIGTDHVVVRRTALTGSIGVLVQWGDVSELMKTVGVKLEEVKSSPMKAEPTPFKPVSPEARAMLDAAIRDTYDWFVGLVAERRGLTREKALELADGRVVTGHQAVALKLADEIGEESAATAWLVSKGWRADCRSSTGSRRSRTRRGRSSRTRRRPRRAACLRHSGSGAGAAVRSLDGLRSDWHLGRDQNRAISRGSVDDQVRAGDPAGGAQPASLPARRGAHRQCRARRDHGGADARRSSGAAWLRRLLGEEPSRSHRPQSAHRREVAVTEKIRALLQDGQGNARTPQRRRRPRRLSRRPNGVQRMKRILTWLLALPIGVVVVALAVANRRPVTLSLDPFKPDDPVWSDHVAPVPAAAHRS